MQHVKGQYGYSICREHPCMICASDNGSMTSDILLKYLQYLRTLYPDLHNKKGKHFC